MTSQTRSNPWAHPRVSGENFFLARASTSLAGSSPRERGKLEAPVAPYARVRLIPA